MYSFVILCSVSIDFFDGIFIKDENMMAGSYYDETEKIWVWKYEDEQNEQKLFMDVGKYLLVVLTGSTLLIEKDYFYS